MINKRDLMIGNWVINAMGTFTEIESGRDIDTIDEWMPLPIELKPEILIASGFESLSSAWFQKGFFKVLFYWDEKDGYSFNVTTHDELVITPSYRFVHQLQNCYFWLEGEELEIELPID